VEGTGNLTFDGFRFENFDAAPPGIKWSIMATNKSVVRFVNCEWKGKELYTGYYPDMFALEGSTGAMLLLENIQLQCKTACVGHE
jgi:hypothetical protein